MKTRRPCKCGAEQHLIRGGGEYFKKLKKPVWVCVSKVCPFKRKRITLQFK